MAMSFRQFWLTTISGLFLTIFCGFCLAQQAQTSVDGAASSGKTKLTACASNTPPFVIMTNGVGTAGYSFELFQNIASQLGRSAEVRELPWARCLLEVKSGEIDLAIDAYDDVERRKTYLYTNPYYTLTPQIFYRANKHPPQLPAKTVKDLTLLKGCGVHEYTYEHYDIDANVLDLGATDDLQMMNKLNYGRCDFAVEELEYIIGQRKYVPAWLDDSQIASFRPTWARGPKLHFLIGKDLANAGELQNSVNLAIEKATKSKYVDRLMKRYFQTGK